MRSRMSEWIIEGRSWIPSSESPLTPFSHGSPWCPIYSRSVVTLFTSSFPYSLECGYTHGGPTS
jgi:hypothetical protein